MRPRCRAQLSAFSNRHATCHHARRNQLKIKLVLALLLLALAGASAYFLSSPRGSAGPDKKDPAKAPVPVTVARAELRDMPVLLALVGRGEAYESVTLRARVDGQVLAVPFSEGQVVNQGDVLVRLDPADFQARLRQAEANLARDEALLAKARADVARYTTLRASGFVSAEKVGEVSATAQAAQATVQADRAALDLARLQLGYATLRAPFAGVVGAKLAFPGAAVKLNDTPLVVINRVRPLYVGFAVPERHLPAVRAALARPEGLKASIGTPGADPVAEAPVRFLDNAVDPATGTIQAKALLANEDARLAPGQFVNVSLTLALRRDAVVVPVEAVQQGPEGAFVYVLRPDQGVALRPVRVADHQQSLAVIAQGLAAGETVITDGQLRLTPKTKVKIKAPAPAGRPAS